MKRKPFRFLTSTIVAITLTTPAFAAAPPSSDNSTVNRPRANPPGLDTSRPVSAVAAEVDVFQLGPVQKASDLIGRDVTGSNGEKIADVSDLAVDLESGQALLAILSYGGVIGVGAEHTAVPLTALKLDTTDPDKCHLNSSEADLKAAPKFDASRWADYTDASHLKTYYDTYGARMDYPNSTTAEGKVPKSQADREARSLSRTQSMGALERASKLLGATVRNSMNDDLGDVNEILLDVPNGRIVDVVLSSGGFLGIGDQKSVVPPTILSWDSAHEVVQIDATKEQLAAAPHFESQAWPQQDSSYVVGVYRVFGVTPYFQTAADNTARNSRDLHGNTVTPIQQGNSAADLNMTAQIRKDVMNHDGFSTYAKNIKIITRNGDVTLRGPVKSDQEKREIGDIAAQVAGADHVENQLEVKETVSLR